MTTGRINQVTAFRETGDQPFKASHRLRSRSPEAKELIEGFLSEMDTCPGPCWKGRVGRMSNCLDALLNVLPALHQRPESVEEQTARTRLPARGRQAGGVIILRLSAGRAFVLASTQPAQPEGSGLRTVLAASLG